MRMFENGSKYLKLDDSYLELDSSIWNGMKMFKIEWKCLKFDGCV